MVDLLKKRVSVVDPYILLFFYPTFQMINNIKECLDYEQGVVYTGTITEDITSKLNILTNGKYILLSEFGDVVLYKPSDFIKLCFPVLKDKAEKYDNYEMEEFIPILKEYYILQKRPPLLKDVTESNIYMLYKAMIMNKDSLRNEYFRLLGMIPIRVLSSSILTFLIRVKGQNLNNCSPIYKKLLNSAYLKFGRRIKDGVLAYIKSSATPEVSLWMLLEYLTD